ncbi:hypothetical protein Pla175_45640 [Pirellulimonas nuda]|uniref:Uncharacterized protein n=1 Tax=Pirellulimonas nuda TaxID=2528009 RepID=A0A518DI55_9BACT|nr:hypothetical protein [Pirellulimonas nuda]QDU91144.1 hypothetical protein Pla175_45640 [Pirellulimonas nuda]
MRIRLTTMAVAALLAGVEARCWGDDGARQELAQIDAEIRLRSAAIAASRADAPTPRPMPYPKTTGALWLGAASGVPISPEPAAGKVSAELVSEIADLFDRRRETLALLARESEAEAAASAQPEQLQPQPAVAAQSSPRRVLGLCLLALTAALAGTAVAVKRRAARPGPTPMTDADFRRAAGGAVRRLVA